MKRVESPICTTCKDDSGFTLVEVIVSMALMAMVFTAAFGSYFLGMRMVDDAREQLRASQIVQSELEKLRTMNWATLSDTNKTPRRAFIIPEGEFVKTFANKYTAYRIVETIGHDMKRVVIYVWWKNSNSVYSFETFNTVIVQEGLNDYYYRKV